MNRIETHGRPPPGRESLPETPAEGQLASLVGALWEAGDGLRRPREECPSRQPLPSRNAVIDMMFEPARKRFKPEEFDAFKNQIKLRVHEKFARSKGR